MKKLISIMVIIIMMLCAFSANAEETGKSLIIYFDYSENIGSAAGRSCRCHRGSLCDRLSWSRNVSSF